MKNTLSNVIYFASLHKNMLVIFKYLKLYHVEEIEDLFTSGLNLQTQLVLQTQLFNNEKNSEEILC